MTSIKPTLFNQKFDYSVPGPQKPEATLSEQKTAIKAIRQNRSLFDQNNDGYVTKAELKDAIDRLPELKKKYAKAFDSVSANALNSLVSNFDPLLYGNIDKGSKAFFGLSLDQDGKGKDDFSAMSEQLDKGKDFTKQAGSQIKDFLGTDYAQKSEAQRAEAFAKDLEEIRTTILDDKTVNRYAKPGEHYTGADDFLKSMEGWLDPAAKKSSTDDAKSDTQAKGDDVVRVKVTLDDDSADAQHAAWKLPAKTERTGLEKPEPVGHDTDTRDSDDEVPNVRLDRSLLSTQETDDSSADKPVALEIATEDSWRFKGWEATQDEAAKKPKAKPFDHPALKTADPTFANTGWVAMDLSPSDNA